MSIANQTTKNTGSGGNTKPTATVDVGKQLFPGNPQAATWYNHALQAGQNPQGAYIYLRKQLSQQQQSAPIFPTNGTAANPSMNPMVTQPFGSGAFDPWNTQAPTYYNPPGPGQKLGGVSQNQASSPNAQQINPGAGGGYGQLFSGTGNSFASSPQMGYGTLYGGLVDTRFSDGIERTTPQSQLDVSQASGMNAQDRFTMAKVGNGGFGWNPGSYPVYGPNGPAVIHQGGAQKAG